MISATTESRQRRIARSRAVLSPARLAIGITALIGVFALAGGIVILEGEHGGVWDLDGNWTLSAAFSALLLASAALAALTIGRRRVYGLHRSAYLLALLFLFMSFDEAFSIHERLETAAGVDWETLYVPLFLVCGIAWLVVTRAFHRFRLAQGLMVLGAVAWSVAQILEKVQWNGDEKVAAYNALMFAEEILEMGGSALFLVALYSVLRRADRGSPPA